MVGRSMLRSATIRRNAADLWEGSFHPGNVHPASITLALLARAFQKLPPSVREVRVRADSAFYSHEIVNFLKEHGAFFTIAVRFMPPMKARLAGLRYHRAAGDVAVAEFRYQPHQWQESERFIALRRPVPEEPTWQLSLFQMKGYSCQVLVTNLPLTGYHLWRFYNSRATPDSSSAN